MAQAINIQAISAVVQRNCDIADARYGGEDTLCIYLLRMRDYYHWLSGLPMGEMVDRERLGEWIAETESVWDDLENLTFSDLPLPTGPADCFDDALINEVLNPAGYVYSGGLGNRHRPVFFLGELERIEQAGSQRVLVSETELARGLVAPPAMSRSNNVFVRRDALRRYLRSMVEEWTMNKGQQAGARAIAHYDFSDDPDGAIEAMVEHELENLILHEIGEQIAGELIGDRWHGLLELLENPVDEFRARAVRDNLADCATSLPAFLALKDTASLDFYYANMTPLRREMFPSFCTAYREARACGDLSGLPAIVRNARAYWLEVGRRLVSRSGSDASPALGTYLESVAY